jgi:hypothetical protein
MNVPGILNVEEKETLLDQRRFGLAKLEVTMT